MKTITNAIFAFILLLYCMPLHAQKAASKAQTLVKNKVINGELSADGVDKFSIKASENDYVYGYVNQISVDVAIHITDPDGKKIGSFDNPARGKEHFNFSAETAGTYNIEVESFKENEGAYSIELVKLEPVATDPTKRVDQLLSAYDNRETPGAVVGVVKNGKVVFSKGYGMANLTHDIPFTTDLSSNIGSVSKQFTAMAILLLEREGKLSLDDDVRKHIPELPDLGKTVKLKNLLNHTNGWREIYNTMPMRGWNGEDMLMREEAIGLIQRQTELQDDPGETFNYNNTAFILLAEIVERITEEKFPAWMKKNIFTPLGMNHTMVRAHPAQIVPRSTQGYNAGEEGFVEAGDLYAAYGAGGIYTTINDLAKWLNNFNAPKVGDADMIHRLVTPDTLNSGDTMNYALGIGVLKYRGLKKYQHTGGDVAHRALLAYYPEINSGVITMSNNGGYPLSVANEIGDLFFEEDLEPKEEKADEKEEKADGTVEVDESTLKKYAGKYKMEAASFVIEYKFEDGQLVAHPQGQPSLPLVATSDSTFNYQGVDAQVVFHVDDEEINSATHHQGGGKMKMSRLTYKPTTEDLKAFEGIFYSKELQTSYSLMIKDEKLIAKHINMKAIDLTPVEEDEFSGSAFFFAELKFIRDDEGNVTAFEAANGRTKGMKFVKQD